MASTTVVLVRHGETDWNRDSRVQGWAPVELNGRGRRQARELGASLADRYAFDQFVASDLRRARETAAILLAGGVGTEPRFDPGWRERDVGIYQGLDRETLQAQFPAFVPDTTRDVREQPEGGESLRAVHERVTDAWDRLLDRANDETALVVTHGGPIRLLLGAFSGQDIPTAVTERSPGNCTATEIQIEAEPTVVRTLG